MKCFYHNDPDGICAGFWVRQKHPDGEFRPINYGQLFPFDDIQPNEEMYIVDYSIEPEEMERLLSITPNVTWIDHHKTAIDKYADFPVDIHGVRCDGVAACMLTHDFIMPKGSKVPWFTRLIADWDVWTFAYGEETRRFQAAFTALSLTPESTYWNEIVAEEPHQNSLLTAGAAMLGFRDGWAKSYMELGFETNFEGCRCFAVNLGRCNSEYFKSLTDNYDILMPFVFNGSTWTVSLYSKLVDVSEIAKKYGGGGHRGAAGFQCEKLPFTKNQE